MSDKTEFAAAFQALTGVDPFPWQDALYERLASADIPSSCDLPTGLGKTAVIPIWLIALANHPDKLPRRLVYVVNRRTVVDQATREAEKLRDRLIGDDQPEALRQMAAALRKLTFGRAGDPVAISTLRGHLADNADWRSDPARASIIVGTVDMIGSRLLFSGYGLGFKSKPLHAGFLGQDVFLVHDEAHLEPAFQILLTAIGEEQRRCAEFKRFHVMELSATSRGSEKPFELTDAEKNGRVPEVKKRLHAKKTLHFHSVDDERRTADHLTKLALAGADSGQAILVFVRKVEDAEKIFKGLPKERACQLTGTMRGLERDDLVRRDIFVRFLPRSSRPSGVQPKDGTVWLVCTSAGEVGVNITADHMVCDLTPFDSMAQRFGRVNRFGECDARIDVVHPTRFVNRPFEQQCELTLQLLRRLGGNASPAALGGLPATDRQAAFTPEPEFLLTSEILFDAWSLTSIREAMPGRPPVAAYLHGIAEWEPPETRVAWRQEVSTVTGELLDQHRPSDLLDDYPLKPHELLRDRYDRVFKHLERLAEKHPAEPVWLVTDEEVLTMTLAELASRENEQLADMTVLLPPGVGGLTAAGTLGDAEGRPQLDVADAWYVDESKTERRRVRVWDGDADMRVKIAGMRLVRSIVVNTEPDNETPVDEDDERRSREWRWYVRPRSAEDDGSKMAMRRQKLDEHNMAVGKTALAIADAVGLDGLLRNALATAGKHHDDGKDRKLWQLSIGNQDPNLVLAKSGNARAPAVRVDYRHELGSLLDLMDEPEFKALPGDSQELVLHLIAAHHGRARPCFDAAETFDPERPDDEVREIVREIPRRFSRLQRRYGRWGLAYLESLLRASDAYASANVTEEACE